jgi:8-oxo-dGTP diphosphatase
MQLIKTISDSDFGLTTPFPIEYKDRTAARAVVFDHEGKIALIHATNEHYHKLPGGGVDAGEEVLAALARELLEEIGCAATNVRELGSVEEFRSEFALHQVSLCFLADLVGEKGQPCLMEDEKEAGFETVWTDLSFAIAIFEEELKDVLHYEGKFMVTRDLAFLKKAGELLNI